MLLEALPLEMDREGLAQALAGVDPAILPAVPGRLHPLEEIELIHGAVFTARRGVSRDQKGKAQAADQTRRSAPAVVPEDPAAAIEAAQKSVEFVAASIAQAEAEAKAAEDAALAAGQAAHDREEDAIKAQYREAARSEKAAHEQWAASKRAEVEEQIARAAAHSEEVLASRRAQDEARLDAIDAALQAQQQDARETRARADADLGRVRAELATGQQRLATLREQSKGAASALALHQQARRFEEEAQALLGEAGRLTAALEKLDALRRRLAKDLPIDGLTIEGREIRVHGVQYSHLNTAQRVEIAVKVACLRARGSRLPVVFVDGAEALDQEHFDLLVAALRRAGTQAFLARVEDHDFRVVIEEAPHATA